MDWIYLSPHFDDAVFSCGGLLWEQAQAGESVTIWTICAGEPLPGDLSQFAQMHHIRWESGEQAVAHRMLEDQQACRRVGAAYRYLPVPDCIYRRAGEDYFGGQPGLTSRIIPQDPRPDEHLYTTLEAILGPLRPEEESLVGQVSAELSMTFPPDCQVVCPLALGGHTDHRLTRQRGRGSGKTIVVLRRLPLRTEIDPASGRAEEQLLAKHHPPDLAGRRGSLV